MALARGQVRREAEIEVQSLHERLRAQITKGCSEARPSDAIGVGVAHAKLQDIEALLVQEKACVIASEHHVRETAAHIDQLLLQERNQLRGEYDEFRRHVQSIALATVNGHTR